MATDAEVNEARERVSALKEQVKEQAQAAAADLRAAENDKVLARLAAEEAALKAQLAPAAVEPAPAPVAPKDSAPADVAPAKNDKSANADPEV